jgi:PKD repeat protein
MKNYFLFISMTFSTLVLFNSCKKESPVTPVVAEAKFTIDGNTDSIPAQIQFINNSSGISYKWNFGDGTSSTEKNPSHTYTEYGTYRIMLTAIGSNSSDSLMKEITIGGTLGQIGYLDSTKISNSTDFKVRKNYINEITQIPYGNGNGGVYNSISIISSGVIGLIAKLEKGKLNNGDGELEFSVSGTPTSAGNARFSLSLGGNIYQFSLFVSPDIITLDVTAITSSTAIGGGNIITDGGSSISQRGVCWSTSPNPTLADGFTSDGIGEGIYNSSIQNLTPFTTYYVRAYATSNLGTTYGDQLTFKTTKFCESGKCIGDTFQGGLIANLLTPGENGYDPNVPHGFIVALEDQSTNSNWGSAHTICNDLVLNGYSDWYLPERGQFQSILNNVYLNGLINISPKVYWTSNEYWTGIAPTTPFAINFNLYENGGSWSYERKTNYYNVRAVRNF